MDAFDADVLIMAAKGFPAAAPIAHLFETAAGDEIVGVGSVLLLPEVLSHPLGHGETDEYEKLAEYTSHLHLAHVDQRTAQLCIALRAKYRLRTVDATHLATALLLGASRFITNNHKDFKAITEIDVVAPAQF